MYTAGLRLNKKQRELQFGDFLIARPNFVIIQFNSYDRNIGNENQAKVKCITKLDGQVKL